VMIEQDELKTIISHAINDFNLHYKYLIEKDVSERCICSAFARCVEKRLPDREEYNNVFVDVEYNRGAKGNERAPKHLHDKHIVVDLIVHRRGYDNERGFYNLICVVMKKSTDRRGYEADKIRLQEMVSYDYGFIYKCGYMINADMSEHILKIEAEYYL